MSINVEINEEILTTNYIIEEENSNVIYQSSIQCEALQILALCRKDDISVKLFKVVKTAITVP